MADLTEWQLDRLARILPWRGAGGALVDYVSKGEQELIDAGFAELAGSSAQPRLKITEEGRLALLKARKDAS